MFAFSDADRYLVIMDDNVPAYAKDSKFYQKQLEKGLAMNILKNGKWGSIRHLSVTETLTALSEMQKFILKTKKYLGEICTLETCLCSANTNVVPNVCRLENIDVEYISVHNSIKEINSSKVNKISDKI